MRFELLKRLGNSLFVRLDQAMVLTQDCHERHGLRSGNREVVQIPAVRTNRSIGGNPVGALPLAHEFAGSRVKPLAQSLKVLSPHVSLQTEQLCSSALPPSRDALAFGVVVAMFEVPGRISVPVGNGTDREHISSFLVTTLA